MLMTYLPMATLSSTCRYLELRISPSCGFFPGAKGIGKREPMQKNNATVISYFACIKYLKFFLFLWIFETPHTPVPQHTTRALAHTHTHLGHSTLKAPHTHTSMTHSVFSLPCET